MRPLPPGRALLALGLLLLLAGCGGESAGGDGPGDRRGSGFRPGGGLPGGGSAAAVPVEVAPVERRSISAYIETNGTLEAENEVDVVARASAPIVELRAEEGDVVGAGDLLARLDVTEFQAALEISRVEVKETRQAYERSVRLLAEDLVSSEAHEAAAAAYESAQARFEANRILLGYTEIRAPFDGVIVLRYVGVAQQVSSGEALYRISDFDPLLCPIRVPEGELPRLHVGQSAWLEVESRPAQRFSARVLRISPVVDAATGTVKVTLEASPSPRLRPGMFARVFLEAERKEDSLVIPKAALSLESIGDVVYVAAGNRASRREVDLGFREGNSVEVLSGVQEGEQVVVVGQDGLSEGTPIQVLDRNAAVAAAGPPAGDAPPAVGGAGRGEPGRPDLSGLTPEQIERLKGRMRARGLTDEQIEARLREARERAGRKSE